MQKFVKGLFLVHFERFVGRSVALSYARGYTLTAMAEVKRLSTSSKIYAGLVLTLAVVDAIYVFRPAPSALPVQDLTIPTPVIVLANALIAIVLYGGLGLIGLKLSERLGFAQVWDPMVSNRQRFLVPALTGAVAGVFFIVTDSIVAGLQPLGRLPHPAFPDSLLASAAAGIGEEIIFRLFFVPFWLWLISIVILRKRWTNIIFWIVAVYSAIVFAAGHFPSYMLLMGMSSPSEIPPILIGEIFLLNGVISIFAAVFLRRYGLLAAVGIHFWTDFVWHVIYGLF